MNSRAWMRDIWVLVAMLTVSITNLLVFGLAHARSWKDASEYSAYATNLITKGLYSLNGSTFDIFREPGYPFFLAFIYKIFGNENLLAVCFIQSLLLGVAGFLIYRVFAIYTSPTVAIAAGLFICAIPSYGYYANEITSELFFSILLAIIFYICVFIWRENTSAHWYWFMALGFFCGFETLVRTQFIFFLPLIMVIFIIYRKTFSLKILLYAVISILICATVLGSWVSYVHKNTGHFAITSGRQEEMLYYRAVRAQLSYGDLTRYAHDWLLRSFTGGYTSQLLYDNEFKALSVQYLQIATTTNAVKTLEKEDVEIILHRPGQYLYGNLIEAIKLAYLEHDYSNSQSRLLRPAEYLLIYGFCLFGIYAFISRRGEIRKLCVLALIFPAYNFLVLTPFDVIPRYNTPYLMFYVVIGFIGVVLFRRDHDRPRS